MSIDSPIIIFGSGRSGTTIFHHMLAEHPRLSWMSELCNRFPAQPDLNGLLMKSLDYPLVENILKRKIQPGECYSFWNYYFKGFGTPTRDLTSADVTVKTKKLLLPALSALTTKKRQRLLLKVTGWPRTGFFTELFADPKLIHVIRDGRAVANSLINVGFWRGWGGPEKWRWGLLSEPHRQEWHHHNQSFIVLAGIQWKILMDAAERSKSQLRHSHILEIKYEELCANPIPVFQRVADFCKIEWRADFEARLNKYKLINTNKKYQQELTDQQQNALENVLASHLTKYGYQ